MKLKLQLVRDGEVLFEIPISPADWPEDRLENESEAACMHCGKKLSNIPKIVEIKLPAKQAHKTGARVQSRERKG